MKTTTEKPKTEREEYIQKLRETLNVGDTIYTVLRHVSKSGMQRRIDCYVMRDNTPVRLSYWIAKALCLKDKDGIIVNGCGMDMGYHLVNSLSYAIHGMDHPQRGYTLEHRWL